MTTCFLGFGCFGCSPAGVGGLQLDDVDFSVFVGSREDTTLWSLWLHVAAQVVQRQELGINLAGVRKHWIWKRRDVCVSLRGGSARLFWGPKWEIQLFVTPPPQGGSEQKVSYRTAPPASGRYSMTCSGRLESAGCLLWPSRSSWTTASLLTSLHSPAAGTPIVSAPARPSPAGWGWACSGWHHLVSNKLGKFLFSFDVGKPSQGFLSR